MNRTPLRTIGCVLGYVWVGISAAATCGAANPTSQPASQPSSRPSSQPVDNPTTAEIQRSIRLLNHPSKAKRDAAFKQLCIWGPITFAELRAATQRQPLETALAARDVLKELEQAALIGSTVELQADKTTIKWNEVLALTVRMTNPTAAAILAPWPDPKDETPPDDPDARQVGALLDIADFITIEHDGHRTISLRIDPINDNKQVSVAVRSRASNDPPTHPVAAGKSASLTVEAFNRGWARFFMPYKGTYTIRFHYQPQWSNKVWVKEGIGRVASEPIRITITDNAPLAVQKATVPVQLNLARVNGTFEATLLNVWDRATHVNLNLAPQLGRDATLQWKIRSEGETSSFKLDLRGDDVPPPFSIERFHELDVGQSVVVGRVTMQQLLDAPKLSSITDRAELQVEAAYLNACDGMMLQRWMQGNRIEGRWTKTIFAGEVSSEALPLNPPAIEVRKPTDSQPQAAPPDSSSANQSSPDR